MAPEIAGTELEKELEGTRLFHYFPEGMWVYYNVERIYYIVEKESLEWDKNPKCPVHWNVRDIKDLPENRRENGFGNSDFYIKNQRIEQLENSEYIVAIIEVPSKYITYFSSGLYYDNVGWSYTTSKQLKW